MWYVSTSFQCICQDLKVKSTYTECWFFFFLRIFIALLGLTPTLSILPLSLWMYLVELRILKYVSMLLQPQMCLHACRAALLCTCSSITEWDLLHLGLKQQSCVLETALNEKTGYLGWMCAHQVPRKGIFGTLCTHTSHWSSSVFVVSVF